MEIIGTGAERALKGYQAAKMSADSLDDADGNTDYRSDIIIALRGDKDAAYRIALMYRDGVNGLKKNAERTEHWLGFAAELGNGIASWELSVMYSLNGQTAEQARYEKLAIDLGYTPPARLGNRGY